MEGLDCVTVGNDEKRRPAQGVLRATGPAYFIATSSQLHSPSDLRQTEYDVGIVRHNNVVNGMRCGGVGGRQDPGLTCGIPSRATHPPYELSVTLRHITRGRTTHHETCLTRPSRSTQQLSTKQSATYPLTRCTPKQRNFRTVSRISNPRMSKCCLSQTKEIKVRSRLTTFAFPFLLKLNSPRLQGCHV